MDLSSFLTLHVAPSCIICTYSGGYSESSKRSLCVFYPHTGHGKKFYLFFSPPLYLLLLFLPLGKKGH